MDQILVRMHNFPTGGWDIDDFEDLSDWAASLRELEPTKSLRTIRMELKRLSARIEDVATPAENDDDFTEDEDVPSGVVEDRSKPVKQEKDKWVAPSSVVVRGVTKRTVDAKMSVRLFVVCLSSSAC